MSSTLFPPLSLSIPPLSLSALPLAPLTLPFAFVAGLLALTHRRRCRLLPAVGRSIPLAVLFAMSSSSLSQPRTAPLLALLAAAVGLAVPLVLFLQSRRSTRMNGHAAPLTDTASPLKTATPAAPRRIAKLRDAVLARFRVRRAPQHPAPYPESCFDDDFLRILRAAHERSARRAVPAKTLPPAPWPKDWPVYWEGGGPAGLGRWA